MEYKEMRKQLMATMKEFGYKYNKIAVELCGKIVYLTETEVRALQVMVKRDPSIRENIKIYNGRTKRGSEIIDICENGYLDKPLSNDFFAINTKLSRDLMF